MRAGVRRTRNEKDFVAGCYQSPLALPGVPDRAGPFSANPGASKVSWDLSGLGSVSDAVSLYASVATGFRAPSIQGRLLFGNSISVAQTETLLS